MRLTPWLVVAVLTIGFLGTGVQPAAACSCLGGSSPCQAFAAAPVVFVGEVVSVERVGDEFRMRLRVERALKGIEAETADLWSSAISSCGVRLREGGRYVIYTNLSNGRMSIDACDYGRALASGEPDPELPPVPGRIYGRVTRYDIDRIRDFRALAPIPSIGIAIDTPAGRLTAASDTWGRFQFADVPPGTYQIAVDAGPGLTPWMGRTVAMPAGEACVETSVVLQPAGRVTGRVETADGQPARGIYVRLVSDGTAGSYLVQRVGLGRMTGPDGQFTFEGLSPESYVLAVNPEGTDATGRQPYAPAWFGGTDRASATRIRIAEGSTIELDRPFVLPEALATRTFTVAVTCRDGSVPAGLVARAMAANGAVFAESAETAETATGPVQMLTLVRDQSYTLLVSIYIPVGPASVRQRERRKEELPPTDLPAGAPGGHIALVAPFGNCAEPGR